jgi:hypothetical protein
LVAPSGTSYRARTCRALCLRYTGLGNGVDCSQAGECEDRDGLEVVHNYFVFVGKVKT